MNYAGFWRRVLSYIIDAVILIIAEYVITAIIGLLIGKGSAKSVMEGLDVIIGWLYFALQESSAGQATLGKRAIGLVVMKDDGSRIGFGTATGRYFGKIISGLILGIGFMMAGWTKKKQALHDLMAGTLVVKKNSVSVPQDTFSA